MQYIPKKEKLNKFEILIPAFLLFEVIVFNLFVIIQQKLETSLLHPTIYSGLIIGLFILFPFFSRFIGIRLNRRFTFLMWLVVSLAFAITSLLISDSFNSKAEVSNLNALKLLYLPICSLLFYQFMRIISIFYLGLEPAFPNHREIGKYDTELNRKIIEADRGFGFIYSILSIAFLIAFFFKCFN